MSTVIVDDQLYRRTIEMANAQGKTVEEFVSDALRQVVDQTVPRAAVVRRSSRNGLPVMVVSDTVPAVDPQKVRKSIEEEGF
jgi:hypothetical protein